MQPWKLRPGFADRPVPGYPLSKEESLLIHAAIGPPPPRCPIPFRLM
jgi:hypothetical protein